MNYQNETAAIRYVLERLKDQLALEKICYQSFIETRTSYLYKFKSGSVDTPKEIVIKLYKTSRSTDIDVSPSENDYKFLKQLSKYCFNIPDIVIPRPIMHLPEVNGIVMEHIDGLSLQKFMPLCGRFSSKNEKKKLEVYFTKVGRVIGLIQARTYKPNSDKPKLYINAKLKSIKSQIHYSHLGPLQKYVRQALKCIEEGVSVLSGDFGIAWTHGDLIHGNVLITNQDKVALLDFAESRFDSPYHDISRFTVRTLIDYGCNPLRYSSYYLRKLNHNFLNGYSSSFPHKISDETFHLYYIFNIIQFISFLYKLNISSLTSLRDWHTLFLLKKYMQACPW